MQHKESAHSPLSPASCKPHLHVSPWPWLLPVMTSDRGPSSLCCLAYPPSEPLLSNDLQSGVPPPLSALSSRACLSSCPQPKPPASRRHRSPPPRPLLGGPGSQARPGCPSHPAWWFCSWGVTVSMSSEFLETEGHGLQRPDGVPAAP